MENHENNLVFLEDRTQVFWANKFMPHDASRKFIALTAAALEALEEVGLPHQAVSHYADTRQLSTTEADYNRESFSLLTEIESYIAKRVAAAKFDGPGFLTSQGYWIQYSISAIATRSFLMRETIRACRPKVVTLFEGEIDPWFAGDSYTENPWCIFIRQLSKESGLTLEIIPRIQPSQQPWDLSSYLNRFQYFAQNFQRRAKKGISLLIKKIFDKKGSSQDPLNLRLLMVHQVLSYDWLPVLESLKSECFVLNSTSLDARPWTYFYTALIHQFGKKKKHLLEFDKPVFDEGEKQTISKLFDEWLLQRPEAPTINVLGMNLFPALEPHLRKIASLSPTLMRHAIQIADQTLKSTKPDAVCFYAMPFLADKRLAYRAREKGIPVICYQHGGAYGTHNLTMHDHLEWAHADYFLVYGRGVIPRPSPLVPTRAQTVPVGSARIEAMNKKWMASPPKFKKRKNLSCVCRRKKINILWLAEISFRNTVGGNFQVEDTERYLFQKKCLSLLAHTPDTNVVYRPFPAYFDWQATPNWLRRSHFPSVKLNLIDSMQTLIRKCDVVICDTTSATVWNEVLACKKPLLLYLDPRQTFLREHFATDLEKACYWCKTQDSLVQAVEKLAHEREIFLKELQQIESSHFINKYVLHRADGECVARVSSFLHSLHDSGKITNAYSLR